MTELMTPTEAASVALSERFADLPEAELAALVDLVMSTRALARRRLAAQKTLDDSEEAMKAAIRELDRLGVPPGSIDRLTDYSASQRRLAVRGLSRHPGGPQPSTGRRAGRPRGTSAETYRRNMASLAGGERAAGSIIAINQPGRATS